MNFALIKAIFLKDILNQYRSKETFNSVIFFSLLVITIGSFALEPGSQASIEIASGILWISYVFSSVIILNHSFLIEKEEDVIQGLIIIPNNNINIFLGKYLTNFVYTLFIEIIILASFIILFNISIKKDILILLVYIVLVDIGFVCIGSLFASMLINSKVREMLLPILLFPIIIPLIIGAVKSTTFILHGTSFKYYFPYLMLIILFDVVYLISSIILSDYALGD